MSYMKIEELLLKDTMKKAQIPGVSIAYVSHEGVISTQEIGLTDGCGLVKLSNDPTKCQFQELVLGSESELGVGTKNAVVSFNTKLYYVDHTSKTVQKIPLTETNKIAYETLQAKCTETYKLANVHEHELITTLTGRIPPTKVKPETVFGAASLSKPVFAYLVQKLIQANASNKAEAGSGQFILPETLTHFDLDTPLFHILPLEKFNIDGMKFDMSDESTVSSSKALTARMVLSHTTGLAHGEMTFQFKPNPEEKEHGYSNVGIIYLQQVIEKLTGSDLETLSGKHVFAPCGMTHSTYVPRVYNSVLHAEKEPVFEEMQSGQLVILQEDEHLTAYWLENGKIVNRSFPERVVPNILEMLPAVCESSNSVDLIKAITAQYECQEPKPCAANTLRTTAGDYANFVKYLINDSTVENPFVPHVFMTKDKGLAGAIGVAKGNIPDTVLQQVAWGLGWGLQTDDKGRVITAYHSGDMNDYRAWIVIDLQDKDKKNAVVFFANSHNGHILAEQIIPSTMKMKHAANYFFPKWGFARNLNELGGKTTNLGINSSPASYDSTHNAPTQQDLSEVIKESEKPDTSEKEFSVSEEIETNVNNSSMTPLQTSPKPIWMV